MTQVNFYTLGSADPDARLQFVCRLTEKVRKLGHAIFIHTASAAEARQLDDLLWQFKPASFIPHAVEPTGSADATATTNHNDVVLISTQSPPPDFHDVLINLTDQACTGHQQFSRINEIVAADAESIQAGRERYRVYRDLGVSLDTFKI